MLIKNPGEEKISIWANKLENYIKDNFKLEETLYIQLGSKVVRLLIYSKEFSPLIKKQLTYSLIDSVDKYDVTIVLWNEKNVEYVVKNLDKQFDPKLNFKLRIDMLCAKQKEIAIRVIDEKYSNFNYIFDVNPYNGIINFHNREAKTYYYGVRNLEPEEFIKEGHIFVQMFNKIIKDETSNLVHGAVVGYNNHGVLFCARGQRGKSTLTVLSMMEGFDYVSDDYLILEKEGKNLYSYPIYSIITLSPRMYNELYDRLDGCRFVSNNARKDKYVVNIEKFHPQFKDKYPINLCIFPEIVSDPEPSIRLCNKEEKGRAITQLIQSTVSQMQDINDNKTIKKLLNMVKDFEFYKLNLCNNIEENTRYLKEFLDSYTAKESNVSIDRMLVDITFDIANIIDSELGIIYSMNKSATNIFENLINGISKEEIISFLEQKIEPKYNIKHQIEQLEISLKDLGLLKQSVSKDDLKINLEFIKEENYRLFFTKYDEKETQQLIKMEEK